VKCWKIQAGAKVVSVTPEKTKRMRHSFLYFAIILVLLLPACKSSQKTTTSERDSASVQELPDDKKKEFEYLFVEALKQKMIGNQQRAVSLLSACLEIDPNSAAAMFELANMHVANNDLTSASLLLEKAISINPTNKWYKLLLARIYSQTSKFSESALLYDQLIRIEPENQEYIYMKAMMLASAKKYDESIKVFNDLEKKIGINEHLTLMKEQVYMDAGKIKEAFAEIQRLIEFNPQEPRYYGLLADAYLDQGDNENALKYYKKILEMDPDNGYVHFSLANYYRSENNTELSYHHTSKGFASNVVELETKLQLYLLHTGSREEFKFTDQQIEALINILIESHYDDFRVYTVFAEYLIRNKRFADAREQLINVVELGINDFMVWQQLLYLDNELQDWQGLYDHTKSVIDIFPNQPEFYFFHAIACIQLSKPEEAIAIADEGLMYVVDNPPMAGQLTFIKGESYYKMSRHDEAFRYFDEALKLEPENFIALNNYAYYLSLAERDLEKAERMSAKVVEKFPDNPTYLDTYAWVLFKKENYSLAKFYMETALKNGGNENPTLLDHYGDILFKLDRLEEAVSYWEKAKEFGSDSEILDQKINEKRYIREKIK
jgi:tetratricopeptide (TPR) repeat protein